MKLNCSLYSFILSTVDLAFHCLPSFKVMAAASHTHREGGIYQSHKRQDVKNLRVIMTSAGMIITMTTDKFEWIFTTSV